MTPLTCTFTFGATGTTSPNVQMNENGYIENLIAAIPNFTNAVTATIGIYDASGVELYTATGITKNGTFKPQSSDLGKVPVDYGFTMRCSISGDAGGTGGAVTVRAFVSRNKP